jgi:hypothetical protein
MNYSLMFFGPYRQTLLRSVLVAIFSSSASTCLADSIIGIETISGSVSYRLGTDPDSTKCPQKGPMPGFQKEFSLNNVVALCITDDGSVIIKRCPVRGGNAKDVPIYGPVNNFSVANSCAEASPMGGDDFLPGGWDSKIPYVVSPRYTKLLNSKSQSVLFSWNAIGDDAKYKVKLFQINNQGERKLFWDNDGREYSASGNKDSIVTIPYRKDSESELKPGDYELVVASTNGTDSLMEKEPEEYPPRDGVSRRRFTLVDKAQELKIRKEVEILRKSKFPSNKRSEIDVAVFYAQNGLYANAIQELENLLELKEDGIDKPSVYYLLGNLYKKVGLNYLAAKSYSRANPDFEKLCRKFSGKKLPGCPN